MNKRPLVAHVAEIEIQEGTGMGRIAWHWRKAWIDAGFDFMHIGPGETGAPIHKSLWHRSAWAKFAPHRDRCAFVLAHEAVSGIFARRFPRTVVFSHGIEPRGRAVCPDPVPTTGLARLRKAMISPLWARRERQCLSGLLRAPLVLLSNSEDALYLRQQLGRPGRLPSAVFRNGVDPCAPVTGQSAKGSNPEQTILFYGTWLPRKGSDILASAARMLATGGVRCHWVLAGTALPRGEVLRDWPAECAENVTVLPRVARDEEPALYRGADLFVLPSRFEGQPLTLLQAMAHGLCCVSTRCCGQKDLIEEERTGVLVEPGSSRALAEALRRLIPDREARTRIGAAARATVADRSWQAVSAEVVATVRGALEVAR